MGSADQHVPLRGETQGVHVVVVAQERGGVGLSLYKTICDE